MSEAILQQLVDLSRYLGEPNRAYAILGEGNTSARIDDETFYVKASGSVLGSIDGSGFVAVSRAKVLALLDDPMADDAAVTRVLTDARVDPNETRRPSVETLFHALLLRYPGIEFVGHTHPLYTNMMLCSKKAEEASMGRICPDHVVVMAAKSVFIPYVDPGLVLAREIRARVDAFIDEEGVPPRAIMMQGHGLIAVGDSPRTVMNITDMSEKAARIIVGTYSLGGPAFMSEKDIARIYTRPDEKYREKRLQDKG